MSGFKLPRPLCQVLGALNIDFGTMCRSRSPDPSPLNGVLQLQNQSSLQTNNPVQLSETNDLDYLKVDNGQLTFDAEGNDDPKSIYFSRTPHVPSDSSGVTIGRGYDMGSKKSTKIKEDFNSAGIGEYGEFFSKAALKKGSDAKAAIKDNKLSDIVITRLQQRDLFLISYAEIEIDVKRICNKAEVVEKYGNTDWDKLDSKIKDTLIDLRFRGDYTGTSRTYIQKHVADNNLTEFKKVICNRGIWSVVPEDRFNRRCNYLK